MLDISIIIPSYNRLWSLKKAIESCRDIQSKTEIIVIDDGSTDGTWNWLITQADLQIIKQFNSGKCNAVNRGFELAKGKYIRFLDSDDTLNAHAVDEQFSLAEAENSDIVVSGYYIIDEHDSILRGQSWVRCDDFIAQQLGECDGSHYSAFLFRKYFLESIQHRPEFAFRDDRLFILEAALKKPLITIHSGFSLNHRVHTRPKLQNTEGLIQSVQNFQHLELYKKILRILDESNELTQRRKNASIKILWHLAKWVSKNHLNEGVKIIEWIYKLNPQFIIPEKGILGFMYNRIGFKITQQLLKLRRISKF